jgi:transglutaminase-like putative cysteine protease
VKLKVRHTTTYTYTETVTLNTNAVRLQPRESAWQRLDFFLLKVLPSTQLRHYWDFYRNTVHHFEIPTPHRKLIIESNFRIETTAKIDIDDMPYGCDHSRLAECPRIEECSDFIRDSCYVTASPEIWREAVDAQDGSTDVFQTAYSVMSHIFSNYAYRPGVTSASTQSDEVAQRREGVCQDFAHVMIAMCRSLGIPARYASGYLYDPGFSGIRGAQASHAWCEVYLPTGGWYGLDPTNNKIVDDSYVKIATGRDYNDAAPVIGQYVGKGSLGLDVQVNVERVA